MPVKITVPATRLWNNKEEKFLYTKETTLIMEHSLLSISKWESKWHEAFLGESKKTSEQWVDYFKFMTINQNVDPFVYLCFTEKNLVEIFDYIKDPMTATTFRDRKRAVPARSRIITNELLYAWMAIYRIPFECEKWHLNRLMTLIRVCYEENNPQKMSKQQILRDNRALNAARKAKLHTNG